MPVDPGPVKKHSTVAVRTKDSVDLPRPPAANADGTLSRRLRWSMAKVVGEQPPGAQA